MRDVYIDNRGTSPIDVLFKSRGERGRLRQKVAGEATREEEGREDE